MTLPMPRRLQRPSDLMMSVDSIGVNPLNIAQSSIGPGQIIFGELPTARRGSVTRDGRSERVGAFTGLHDERERIVVLVIIIVDAFPA